MAMTITYKVKNGVYVNMTNRCPCACTFCLRQNAPGVYGSDPLWLDREPTVEEVEQSLSKWDLSSMDEVVFCGYGEPTEALDVLCQTAAYLKQQPGCPPLRINTNGLSDLIHGAPTAHRFQGLIDTVSISLNAGDEQEYNQVTRPKFPEAFQALQRFAVDCKQYVPHVMFTVVDVIPKEQIRLSQELADRLGVPLRVRTYDS